jgi:hypothetical protein
VTAGGSVSVDETTAGSPAGFPISATSATAVISATTSVGADTPGTTTYGLTITGGSGTSSGLATAIGDHPITLVQTNATTITGTYQDGGTQTAFVLHINADGTLTLTEDVPLEHLNPANPNDTLNLSGLINATITVTDYDGDHASGSVAIGGNITFYDDGPSIHVAVGSDAAVLLETHDALTIGSASDTASSTANFGGVFSISSSSGGGDGAASTVWAFTLGAVDHTDSGLKQAGTTIYLYQLANGSVVGSTSTTEAGVSAANTVFGVTVNATTGVVTLTQYSEIDHPLPGDTSSFDSQTVHLADGAVTLTGTATITDNDGDTASSTQVVNIGANLLFADDGPSLSNVAAASSITIDETTAGDITGFPISATSGSAMITATAAFGADVPGSTAYGLALANGLASESTTITTSQGDHAVTLVQTDATTLTGQYTDGSGTHTAFTLVMNSNGTVTYTQYVPLDHVTEGNTALAYDDTNTPITLTGLVNATITVTDYDGDKATGSVAIGDKITIYDDGPHAVAPDSITTTDIVQGPIYAWLDTDHQVIDNFGADGPGTITFANITNGMDSHLTSGGTSHHITYWLSADGQTLEGRVDATSATTGTLVFTVHIDQSTSQYDYTQYGHIDNGGDTVFGDLTSTNAGNVLYRGIGANDAATHIDVLLSGTSTTNVSGTVNTDSTAIGVSNQSMDAGETLRMDFVSNLTSNAAHTTGFDFTAHATTKGFIGLIPQVQGAQSNTVSFTVYALNSTVTGSGAPDSNPLGAPAFSDSTIVQVTSVYAQDYLTGTTATLDISGLAVGSTTAVGTFGVTVTKNADGSVTFNGIQEGDHYGVNTTANFNALAVHDVSGSFDIGVFSLSSTSETVPVNLSYDLQVTDGDGDYTTVPGAINIALGTGTSAAAINNAAPLNSTLSTNHVISSSLVSSNDNTHHERALAVGGNTVLMGALAAAGLGHIQFGVEDRLIVRDGHGEDFKPLHTDSLAGSNVSTGSVAQPTHIVQSSVTPTHVLVAPHATPLGHEFAGHGKGVSTDHVRAHVPTELLQGTEGHAHGGQGLIASPLTASGIAMPSAQQLAAAAQSSATGTAPKASVTGGDHGAQHAHVGHVLADVLHDGGHGAHGGVQALINALPLHAGVANPLGQLATHGPASVSNGYMGHFAGFAGTHGALTMDHMMIHQDAVHGHG